MTSDNHLLSVLDDYGQQFLSQFDLPPPVTGKRKRSDDKNPSLIQPNHESSSSDEEWTGITESYSSESSSSESEDNDETNVVIFKDPSISSDKVSQYSENKHFMSSKISKISNAPSQEYVTKKKDDDEFERLNIQNDAILHRLVHTQLLSGSLNRELDMTPAKRKKALAGRVIELTGQSKLGKGERAIRQAEHNKASSSIRLGLAEKKKERQQKRLQEAKAVGNYHPAIKGLLSEDDTARKRIPKRQRGLGTGVGKFSGGTLRLRAHDLPGNASPSTSKKRR